MGPARARPSGVVEQGGESMARSRVLAFAVLGLIVIQSVPAAGAEAPPPPRQKWSFYGPFGLYDRAQLQRGFKVYREVCAVCHGLSLLSFRNLAEPGGPGFTREEAAAVAAEYKVKDGPNDQGEMFERAGRLADRFPPPFPNDQAARVVNGGTVPPDFSVIAKARTYERGFPWFIFDAVTQYQEHGVDYITALLLGYEDPPAGAQDPIGAELQQIFSGPGDRDAESAGGGEWPGCLHRRLAADGRPVCQGCFRLPDVGGGTAHGSAQAHRPAGDDLPDRVRRTAVFHQEAGVVARRGPSPDLPDPETDCTLGDPFSIRIRAAASLNRKCAGGLGGR